MTLWCERGRRRKSPSQPDPTRAHNRTWYNTDRANPASPTSPHHHCLWHLPQPARPGHHVHVPCRPPCPAVSRPLPLATLTPHTPPTPTPTLSSPCPPSPRPWPTSRPHLPAQHISSLPTPHPHRPSPGAPSLPPTSAPLPLTLGTALPTAMATNCRCPRRPPLCFHASHECCRHSPWRRSPLP